MRVLFASTHAFLPDAVGGMQTTTDELCIALQRLGVQCAVLVGVNHRTQITGLEKPYAIRREVDVVNAVQGAASRWQADLIFVQSGPNMCSLIAEAVESGLPVCCYLHSVEVHMLGGTLFNHPRIKYISNSQFTAERWKLLFGIDSEVVVPYIDAEKYIATGTGPNVLFVNPVPVKGLEIAFSLADALPQIPFLFLQSWEIPDGLREHLQRRVASRPNIQLQPATSDMREAFATSRVLLMPSLWEEAYGRTVIEAQFNGIPVLASNCGALPSTVGLGGVVVDPHAPISDWADALVTLYHTQGAFAHMSVRVARNALESGNGSADIEMYRIIKNHISAVAAL